MASALKKRGLAEGARTVCELGFKVVEKGQNKSRNFQKRRAGEDRAEEDAR